MVSWKWIKHPLGANHSERHPYQIPVNPSILDWESKFQAVHAGFGEALQDGPAETIQCFNYLQLFDSLETFQIPGGKSSRNILDVDQTHSSDCCLGLLIGSYFLIAYIYIYSYIFYAHYHRCSKRFRHAYYLV